jgi:hypothetical protein
VPSAFIDRMTIACPYSSAHIDGVEWARRAPGSLHPGTDRRPETIEEVRRILRLHAGLR